MGKTKTKSQCGTDGQRRVTEGYYSCRKLSSTTMNFRVLKVIKLFRDTDLIIIRVKFIG